MALVKRRTMSSEVENPTIVRNPNRSLWASVLGGFPEAFHPLIKRSWLAVFAWIRATQCSVEEAAQRTEDFFLRLQTVDPPREGEAVTHFQSFLLVRVTEYAAAGYPPADREISSQVASVVDLLKARKRARQDPVGRSPEDIYARRWALSMLEDTLEVLRAEYFAEGKESLFAFLPSFLSFGGGEERYTEVAPIVGISVSALHVMVFRFRQRYRETLRRLICDTLQSEDDVDSELTRLLVGAS